MKQELFNHAVEASIDGGTTTSIFYLEQEVNEELDVEMEYTGNAFECSDCCWTVPEDYFAGLNGYDKVCVECYEEQEEEE